MTNIERMPDFESAGHDEEYETQMLVLNCLELAQEIVMDEEEDSDRSDLWYVSWADLQAPVEGYMDTSEQVQRQNAAREIHALYMEELLQLYPELQGVESGEDMMLAMAMIPDLPACEGSFTASEYEAENGHHRSVICVEARLGGRIAITFMLMDEDADDMKAYSLGYNSDGKVFAGAHKVSERDMDEKDMLYAVDPGQIINLTSILDGTAQPFEVEPRLTEIRICSEDNADPAVLDTIIAYAREQYEIRRIEQEILTPERPDAALRVVYGMLAERMKQLDPYMEF